MTLFAKNYDEFYGIITNMKKLNRDYRVYTVGYNALYKFTDKNGVTDEHEMLRVGHLIDASGDEKDIRSKVFNEIEKEYLSKKHIEFAVDRVNETIDIRTSERASIHLYNFWRSEGVSKTTAELMTENTLM